MPFFIFHAAVVHANDCTATTELDALFLAQTADIQDPGEIELGVERTRGLETADYNLFQLNGELGIAEGWQLQLDWHERRLPDGSVDHAVTAGAGYELSCVPGWPVLRLDLGFHHNGGNGAIAGVTAGQDIGFASWQAGVSRNAAVYTTQYTGALLLDKFFFPVIIEASADDTARGWERWYGAGFYLLSHRNLELGVAYAKGGGVIEDEKRAMVRVNFSF